MITRRSFIKLWGTTLVSASFFGVTGCSAGDAESSTMGSVYMVSKIVGYSGSGLNARTITTEYAYDEKGNLAKITQTVEHPNAANLGTSIDIYTLDYDENGLPKGVSQSQSNKQNDVYVGSLDMAAEVDGEGRYTKLDKAGSGMTYEYDNDGRIKAATAYYASSSDTNGKTFDEKGWMATSSTNGEEGAYAVKRDSAGNVTGISYKNVLGKDTLQSYTLDEHGNVTATEINGAKASEIEYVEIANPSPTARAFAAIKFDGMGHPIFDVVSGTIR